MYFEFGVHITEDPLGRMRLPDKFTEFLARSWPRCTSGKPVAAFAAGPWPEGYFRMLEST
jgi:hypothetical protein